MLSRSFASKKDAQDNSDFVKDVFIEAVYPDKPIRLQTITLLEGVVEINPLKPSEDQRIENDSLALNQCTNARRER
jgi:hypothetical protein